MNTPDVIAEIQQLQEYLDTKTEITEGTVNSEIEEIRDGSRYPIKRTIEDGCFWVKVTVSNTASDNSEWPKIVFTGVLMLVEFKNDLRDIMQRWRSQNMPKVNKNDAGQGITNPKHVNQDRFPIQNRFPLGKNVGFPDITDDEQSHGPYLFPGQSVTFEMNVLRHECLDINEMNIEVNATISRRHLFHMVKKIK